MALCGDLPCVNVLSHTQPPVSNGDVPPGGSTEEAPPKKRREDFTFDKIIGEGSYSTVSCLACHS